MFHPFRPFALLKFNLYLDFNIWERLYNDLFSFGEEETEHSRTEQICTSHFSPGWVFGLSFFYLDKMLLKWACEQSQIVFLRQRMIK